MIDELLTNGSIGGSILGVGASSSGKMVAGYIDIASAIMSDIARRQYRSGKYNAQIDLVDR